MDELGTNLFLRDSLFLFFSKLRCQGGGERRRRWRWDSGMKERIVVNII